MTIRRAATLLVSGMTLAGVARAQVRERIPDAVSCARCTITSKALTTMRPPDDVVADRPQLVSTDHAGRYWMFFEQELPAVYDPTGTFLKSVGRKGSGPGEYQFPWPMARAGDSVVIFDAPNARATVVDSTLTPRRFIAIPWQVTHAVVVAWPTSVVASALTDQRAAAPEPLQLLSLAGAEARVTRAFGSRVAPPGGFPMFSAQHKAALSVGGRVWTAWTQGYDFAEWTSDGTLVRAFQRRPSWFLSEKPSGLGSPTRPPDSFLMGIERDANGLLWVFLRTPKETWKEGWPAMRPGQMEVSSRAIDYGKLYATTIEIIDPDAGRVVARQVIDRLIISAMPGRRVAFFSRDADELGRIDVMEFTLSGR
ncbi:MAG: hypothetical protein P3A28_05750 [Gemmatimonadota bacterium]|nr:hypothetical protein [Gemmatimonadota bacterium]